MREDEDASRGSVERAIKTQHAVRLGDDAEPRQGLAGIGETQLRGDMSSGEHSSWEPLLFSRASLGGCL
jgi:hypothetical protein